MAAPTQTITGDPKTTTIGGLDANFQALQDDIDANAAALTTHEGTANPHNADTDDISEGSTNLYYTDARATAVFTDLTDEALMSAEVSRPALSPGNYGLVAATSLSTVGVAANTAIPADSIVTGTDGPSVALVGEQVLHYGLKAWPQIGAPVKLLIHMNRSAMTGGPHDIEIGARYFNSLGTFAEQEVIHTISDLAVNENATVVELVVESKVYAAAWARPAGNREQAVFYVRTYGDQTLHVSLFQVASGQEELSNRMAAVGIPSPARNPKKYGWEATGTALAAAPKALQREAVDLSGIGKEIAVKVADGEVLGFAAGIPTPTILELTGTIGRLASSTVGDAKLKLISTNWVGTQVADDTLIEWTGSDQIAAGSTQTFRHKVLATSLLANADLVVPYLEVSGGGTGFVVAEFEWKNVSEQDGLVEEDDLSDLLDEEGVLLDTQVGVSICDLDGNGKIPSSRFANAPLTQPGLDAQKNIANGVAGLDAAGKIDPAQIDVAGLRGAAEGEWDPATNSPALTNGTGTDGDFYSVNAAATSTAPIAADWAIGDEIVYSASSGQWFRRASGAQQSDMAVTNAGSPAYVKNAVLDASVTWTVGTSADYASPGDAVRAAQRVAIPGDLTIEVEAGEYDHPSADTDWHIPWGANVTVRGEQKIADGKAALTYTDLPTTVYDTVNSQVKTGSDFTTAYNADVATISALLEDRFAVKIRCTSNRGLARLKGGAIGLIENMLVTDTSGAPIACIDAGDFGATVFGRGSVRLKDMAIHGFAQGYTSQYGGQMRLGKGAWITGCTQGIQMQYDGLFYGHDETASYVQHGQWIISHCGTGINGKGAPTVYASGGTVQCSSGDGVVLNSSAYTNLNRLTARYNAGHGANVSKTNMVTTGGASDLAELSSNGDAGLRLADVSYAELLQLDAQNNDGTYDLSLGGMHVRADATGHASGMTISPDTDANGVFHYVKGRA